MEASKADQGYVYVIGRDTGVIIGEIMLTEVVRGICRALDRLFWTKTITERVI